MTHVKSLDELSSRFPTSFIWGVASSAFQIEGASAARQWQDISLDLSPFKNQQVVLRLYQRVLVPQREAGNAYWRDLTVK